MKYRFFDPFLILVFLSVAPVSAILPSPVVDYIATSENGGCYVTVMGSLDRSVLDKEMPDLNRYIVFRVQEKGAAEELWSMSGIYAANSFLSNDGRHLMTVYGSSIAFYQEGAFIRGYSDLKRSYNRIRFLTQI